MPLERFKVFPHVCLLFIREGKILLGHRQNTGWMDGKYGLPAGHIEEGEGPLNAALREAFEEVGVTIVRKDLQLVHVMSRVSVGGERVAFHFFVKAWQGEPRICEPNLCDDLRWFPLDALPETVIPYEQSGLRKYQEGDFYSEYGF